MWPRVLRVAALPCCVLLAQDPPRGFDEGPLLCFTTNTMPEKPCDVLLHVVPLHGEAKPTVVWRNRDNANVLARLDRDHLLLASYGNPYALVVADLAAGTHRVLADGCPHEFVAVHGGDVLHLGDPRAAARDDFFYATPWTGAGERRRLADARFSRVLQLAGNVAFALAADDGAIWSVSIANGTGRALCKPPASNHQLRVALSPGGQRLAIGSVAEPGDPAVLTVVDVATGAVVRSWSGLPIQLSTFSSFTPSLEVGWHSDDEVVCSETRGDRHGLTGNFVFVRRNLATGEVTDERVYAELGLHHDAPPPPGPAPAKQRPLFVNDVEAGRLLRADRSEPVATFADDWMNTRATIAPDGRSAVLRLGEQQRRFTLFTASRDEGRVLADAFAYDPVWLPAAPAVRAVGR